MSEDGVLVGDNFSPRQLEAIELFAAGTHNCTQVAEHLGVSKQCISKWRRNECFMQAIHDRARAVLRSVLPEIYAAAIKEAKKGNSQHIKIILDHLDNLEKNLKDKQSNSITFTWE